MFCERKQNRYIFSRPYKVFCLGFLLIQGCLIKHARALLVLSPTGNRLPTIASFLSCDSLTPQIRPGCLMTASHLSAHTNPLTERQPAGTVAPPLTLTAFSDWMSLSKRVLSSVQGWVSRTTVGAQLHSCGLGWSWSASSGVWLQFASYIYSPGSFRNSYSVTSTEQWLTWTITNRNKNIYTTRVQDSRENGIIKEKG